MIISDYMIISVVYALIWVLCSLSTLFIYNNNNMFNIIVTFSNKYIFVQNASSNMPKDYLN